MTNRLLPTVDFDCALGTEEQSIALYLQDLQCAHESLGQLLEVITCASEQNKHSQEKLHHLLSRARQLLDPSIRPW